MAWSVGNIGAASFANNADVTPVLPTHNEGDILIAFANIRSQSPTGERVTESGATWTQLIDDEGVSVWGKVAGASESDPTFQFSGGSSGDPTGAAVIQTTGGSLNIEDSASLDNSNSTDVTFAALTIAAANCLVLDNACINNNFSFNPTSGWTEIIDAQTTIGLDMTLAVQHQTTSADTSSHVGTVGGSVGSQTVSVALQPFVAVPEIVPVLPQLSYRHSGRFF